jgi:hypothetical protein
MSAGSGHGSDSCQQRAGARASTGQGHRVATGRGRVTAGRGRVATGRGRVTAGRGRVTAGRGRVTAGRGRVATGRGRVAAGRGRVAAGRGRVAAGRGGSVAPSGRPLFGRTHRGCPDDASPGASARPPTARPIAAGTVVAWSGGQGAGRHAIAPGDRNPRWPTGSALGLAAHRIRFLLSPDNLARRLNVIGRRFRTARQPSSEEAKTMLHVLGTLGIADDGCGPGRASRRWLTRAVAVLGDAGHLPREQPRTRGRANGRVRSDPPSPVSVSPRCPGAPAGRVGTSPRSLPPRSRPRGPGTR